MSYRLILEEKTPPSKPPFQPKKALKGLARLLGLYRSPHGADVSKTFFCDLYCKPEVCEAVELAISGRPSSSLDGDFIVHINGSPVTVTLVQGTARLKPELFFAYENLIAVDAASKVTDIVISPIVSAELAADGVGVLMRVGKAIPIDSGAVKSIKGRLTESKGVTDPVIACILQSRIEDKNSPFCGLYYPAFDVNARSYRLPSWTWTNGVLVRALFSRADEFPGLRDAAIGLARELQRFQVTAGEESGAIMARWDVLNQTASGIAPQLATNDSAYIASYGFLSAFEATADDSFLQSALAVGQWILSRGMSPEGQLFMGKRLDTGSWVKNHLFVDSGFTSTLFAGLYRHTNDDRWAGAALKFETWYIRHLFNERENYFNWNWYDFRGPAKTMFARGQAWAMDGLLATYRITESMLISSVLNRVATTLIQHQSAEGAWYYHLSSRNTGFDAKGTPIIAYHLARCGHLFGDRRYLESAKSAIAWCEANIIRDASDPRSHGGIAAYSEEGTMYGARNVVSIFMYAQAYYLLAKDVLEGEDYEY